MPVLVQTRSGANQFTGLVNAGLFDFSEFDSMPNGYRIKIANMSYHTAGAPGTQIDFTAEGLGATEIILIGRATTSLAGPGGDGDFRVCNFILPRNINGVFYTLKAVSTGKNSDGSVIVDYEIVPYRDDIRPWV